MNQFSILLFVILEIERYKIIGFNYAILYIVSTLKWIQIFCYQ